MSLTNQYIDGIGNIQMAEGVVRMDLMMIDEVGAEQAKAHKAGVLAMSLPAFMRSYQQMSQVIEKMVEQGVLKRQDTPPPAAGTVTAKATDAAGK
jgi:hypothetical protein